MLASCVLAAANDTEDVRNVVAAFATTWNRHDLDTFGKLFAPDADFVNVAGLWWTGRQSQNPRRGVFIFVLTRQNVGWLIEAAQNTEIERTVK